MKANYLPLNYVLAEASILPQTFSVLTYMNFYDEDCASTAITIVFGNTANDINGGFDNEHGTLTPLDIDGVTDIQFIQSNSPEYLNHISWGERRMVLLDGYTI